MAAKDCLGTTKEALKKLDACAVAIEGIRKAYFDVAELERAASRGTALGVFPIDSNANAILQDQCAAYAQLLSSALVGSSWSELAKRFRYAYLIKDGRPSGSVITYDSVAEKFYSTEEAFGSCLVDDIVEVAWSDSSGSYKYFGTVTEATDNTLTVDPTTGLEESECLSEPSFDTTTKWTAGTGWSFVTGKAVSNKATGELSQAYLDMAQDPLETVVFKLTYTITRTEGSLKPYVGGAPGVARNASGTYTDIITSIDRFDGFRLVSDGFKGTVLAASIVPYNEIRVPDESAYGISITLRTTA